MSAAFGSTKHASPVQPIPGRTAIHCRFPFLRDDGSRSSPFISPRPATVGFVAILDASVAPGGRPGVEPAVDGLVTARLRSVCPGRGASRAAATGVEHSNGCLALSAGPPELGPSIRALPRIGGR